MKFFWEVFVTLFVIIDPAGTVPVFLGLTRGRSRHDRNQLAWQATIVAFGVIVAFALFGRTILDYLGVGLPALEGAGGLLLLLVALELLTGKAGEPSEAEVERANVAFVPLGTPLLAGPGAIVATMLYVQRIHGVGDGFALAGAMAAVALAVWLAMRFALVIHRLLTDNGVELVTRIAGLLLAAIAVQLVANSAIAFAHGALSKAPQAGCQLAAGTFQLVPCQGADAGRGAWLASRECVGRRIRVWRPTPPKASTWRAPSAGVHVGPPVDDATSHQGPVAPSHQPGADVVYRTLTAPYKWHLASSVSRGSTLRQTQ
jgi:multiple antibiotic resistance protein